MITVSNVSLTFGGQKLFSGADLKFLPGNCYGIIGEDPERGTGTHDRLRVHSAYGTPEHPETGPVHV